VKKTSKRVRTLSVQEVAQALGISPGSVYRAIRQNRLAALRVGTKPKLRIPKVVIERLLDDPTSWDVGARSREYHSTQPRES
jgi:excisionase family DNA binding protein